MGVRDKKGQKNPCQVGRVKKGRKIPYQINRCKNIRFAAFVRVWEKGKKPLLAVMQLYPSVRHCSL